VETHVRFHPLLAFLDRPEISGGEALAGLLRPGNAGSNTAADHITVLERALEALPAHARPRPGDPGSVRVVARSDSAGATHAFAQACRDRGVWFSFGFSVGARIQAVVDQVPDQAWEAAIDSEGGIRDGAWVLDITGMLDLSTWPAGAKVIVRAERPHPGAQLMFTDMDGHRITAIITDIPDRVIPSQTAGLELNHRKHAREEDRIRQAKATGLRNLPCRKFAENTAWLEAVLTATDLVCWAEIVGFTDTPVLARAEIATFRNLVLHVGARITRGARQVRVRIDETPHTRPRYRPGLAEDPCRLHLRHNPCPHDPKEPEAADTSRSADQSRPPPKSTQVKINEPATRSTKYRTKGRG
jgi:hypothetical protein